MKRIRLAHETKFRQLLAPLHPQRMDKALRWLSKRAQEMSHREGILLPVAFHRLHQMTQRKLLLHTRRQSNDSENPTPVFWCDAGLGGLARWLRAAGYTAHWEYGIDDAELLRRADRENAIVLTTDSGMMERGVLRDGHLRSLWLPPALHIPEQLSAVFAEFNLQRLESRCTQCNGELAGVEKNAIKEQIPPKTFLWLQEFWQCQCCGKIFWNGTHWRKIQQELLRIEAANQTGATTLTSSHRNARCHKSLPGNSQSNPLRHPE